ncbi:MAG TPA: hypothetical protein VEA15_00890 [Caulobacteraceae bacterium]|nr:hypothetical protein [Caulobacteraceae bacterium]
MQARDSLFPTFFLSGFECSSFDWRGGTPAVGPDGPVSVRRDLACETGHDRNLLDDYALLRSLGIAVAREGANWPMIDLGGGRHDLARLDPYIEAANRHQILPIWDLCHYGYPDGLDPFSDAFVERFAAYARAVAGYVGARTRGPHFFTPINEITFFGFMAGEWGWAAPFLKTRADRERLRLALCRADIAAVKAIREVLPGARIVHVDPLVLVAAPRDRPDLQAAAEHETFVDTFRAFDILAGLEHPELGGGPEVLDVVGVNCYSFGQMEYRESGPHAALPPGDDRIRPLCELLVMVWERYRRPMVVAETSGLHEGRKDWLNDVVCECLAAVNKGVELHGICLFPAIDMPDWHNGRWVHNGLVDLLEDGRGGYRRVPVESYIAELRRWQREFGRVTVLDEDPFSDPVRLEDIVRAARRINPRPDVDWH